MDQWNDELNGLFASYKAAVPDPDASANFMPDLWRKIEGRRNITLRVRKLTQIFVGAAAALCAERIVEQVDFVSIGTNDLSQYTFAADREAGELAPLLDPWQPAQRPLKNASGKPCRIRSPGEKVMASRCQRGR